MFSDLLIYQCKVNQWLKLETPNCPTPRSGHQAVYVKTESTPSSIWIFGGEFVSPSQTRFYHYSDLWCLRLRSQKWELINSFGPCARSGHRMITWGNKILLFGGFSDTGSKTTYFDDLWQFDLTVLQWTRLALSGSAPSPRSASLFFAGANQKYVFIVGGYSKSAVTRDQEKGIVYSDVVRLTFERNSPVACSVIRSSGTRPKPPRISMSGVHVGGNRAFLFGGVHDVESEDGEKMNSYFHNDLFLLDFEKAKWRIFNFDVEKAAHSAERLEYPNESANSTPLDSLSRKLVKVTVGEASVKPPRGSASACICPSPRASAGMALVGSNLYLYGGVFEVGDRKVTLDDFYKLDVNHPISWECLYPGSQETQAWFESESEDEEEEEDTSESSECETLDVDDETSDCSEDGIFERAPIPQVLETFSGYWKRTMQFWCELAYNGSDNQEENRNRLVQETTENPIIVNLAKKLSQDFYQSSISKR
ncbi:unnamed protein product [Trichobilharzia szidati]|nr:unnamed protein product [Trichobilharzia szidati]